LPKSQIKYLYENTDLLVAPSFGEGFGLPMAEAMLMNLPVLTTAYGGQSDFCTDKTSWLIDFNFEYAKTHFKQEGSIWAIPKISSLKYLIEHIYNLSEEEISEKTIKAKKYILDNYSSKKISSNIQDAISSYPTSQTKPNIAIFSTFNTKCGIAEYAKFLIGSFKEEIIIFANQSKESLITKDSQNIIRCWNRESSDIKQLKKNLISYKITEFIIQYNFSFISLSKLEEIIYFCKNQKINTHLFLHSTKDIFSHRNTLSLGSINNALQKVTKIYMHNLEDINYLKHFNIYQNSYLFTHGVDSSLLCSPSNRINKIPIIATFGFLLPQKGILELVDIVQNLHSKGKKVELLLFTALYGSDISRALKQELQIKIKKSKIAKYITLNTNFLSQEEIVFSLSSVDKIIFAYQNTQESSSAAVRMGLLSQKEVITTPIKIFDDVKTVVTQSENLSIESISQTIISSLNRPYDNHRQLKWIEENSWNHISQKFYNSLI